MQHHTLTTVFRAGLMDIDKGFQNPANINRLAFRPGQFRIQPRGIGNIADQPVQPLHIRHDDRHQAFLLFRIFHPRRRFDGTAQAGQRVLDLMRHIGGETLDRIHPQPERLGHVFQGTGQIADFIAPRGQVGYFHSPALLAAHGLGNG